MYRETREAFEKNIQRIEKFARECLRRDRSRFRGRFRRKNHLDSEAHRIRVRKRSGRSGCPDYSSSFVPSKDAALDEIGHLVPSNDASNVLHAGRVTVRECDAARAAVLGSDQACQAAHAAPELEDSSVPTDLAVL